MMPIAKFALGRFPSDPKIGALNPSASKFQGARLVSAARTMAEAATPHAAQFAVANFPADFAQQLLAAADAVQASIDLRARMHSDRQNLTATVEQTLKLGRSAALMLEGAIGRLVPRSSPLYAEWQGVLRIRRTSARTQPPVPTPTPGVPKAA